MPCSESVFARCWAENIAPSLLQYKLLAQRQPFCSAKLTNKLYVRIGQQKYLREQNIALFRS